MDTLRFFIIAIPVTFFLFMAADFMAGFARIFANHIFINALTASNSTALAVRSFEPSTAMTPRKTVERFDIEVSKVTPPSASTSTSQPDEVLSIIRTLKKRDFRKILSPLGVQQKRNGVEITTQMALAQITRLYHNNPSKVTAILQNQLPQKFGSTNPSVTEAETA